MSDSHREEHPLLDDISDEEFQLQTFSKRRNLRGRARGKIKGASAIIKHWPDFLSTSITCWWIAVGMVSLFMVVIYNTATIFSIIPVTISKTFNFIDYDSQSFSNEQPNVFVHYIVDEKAHLNLDLEIRKLKNLTNKYLNFSYHIIIMKNDTYLQNNIADFAEENNDVAMNTILNANNQFKPKKVIKNITIEEVSLTKYLDQSIMKKQWRRLPPTFIPFLIRAMSVWTKGGIAFDPIIITNKTLNNFYFNGLYDAFNSYGKEKKRKTVLLEDQNKSPVSKKTPKQLNNIRDIIEALEKGENVYNDSQNNLSEAESTVHLKIRRSISETTKLNDYNNSSSNKNVHIDHRSLSTKFLDAFFNKKNTEIKKDNQTKIDDHIKNNNYNFNQSISNLFPLFLKLFFHGHNIVSNQTKTIGTRKRKDLVSLVNTTRNNSTLEENKDPILINSPFDYMEKKYDNVHINNNDHTFLNNFHSLTVDLKGLLLATESPCHAFIGNIFTDLLHFNSNESLSDFLITELSIFCKGILSSCYGIKIIFNL